MGLSMKYLKNFCLLLVLALVAILLPGQGMAYGERSKIIMQDKKKAEMARKKAAKEEKQARMKDKKSQGTGQQGNVQTPVMSAFLPTQAKKPAMKKWGFLDTGLQAVYPTAYDCPVATSLFASPFRSDGSKRSARFFQGLHGGMDIPQAKGVPLVN